MTIGQTAIHAHVARHTVLRWIEEGLLPVYRSPALGRRRLELARVDALLRPAHDEADERLWDGGDRGPVPHRSTLSTHAVVSSQQSSASSTRARPGQVISVVDTHTKE